MSISTKHIDGDVSVGRNVTAGGNATVRGSVHAGHNLRVDGWLDAPNVKAANKGLFESPEALRRAYPRGNAGEWAIVGPGLPGEIYMWRNGRWDATGRQGGEISIEDTATSRIVDELCDELESLRDEIGELEGGLRNLTTRVSGIDSRVSQTETAVGALHDETDRLQGLLGQIDDRVTGLTGLLEAYSRKLSSAVSRIDGHDNAIEGVVERLSLLESALSALQSDYEAFKESSVNAFKEIVNRNAQTSRAAKAADDKAVAAQKTADEANDRSKYNRREIERLADGAVELAERVVAVEAHIGDCGCSGGGGVADVERISDEEIDALFGSAVTPPEMPADAVAISFDEIEALALAGCDVCDHGSIPDDGISIDELDELLTK